MQKSTIIKSDRVTPGQVDKAITCYKLLTKWSGSDNHKNEKLMEINGFVATVLKNP